MKTLFTSSLAFLTLAATQVLAGGNIDTACANDVFRMQNPDKCTVAVPEISAMEGTAALAAIAAIVLITWERRRRAAA